MATKLFVGNLSFDTTEEDVTELFTQAGEVQQVELINDRETGRPRGFGFVTMADEEGAREAISRFADKEFMGRNLAVNEARARESAPRGGGGGRGYGGGGGGNRDRGRGNRRY